MRPAITTTDIRTIDAGVGPSISNRAVTATLFVSPNGDNSDGTSWNRAFTTIQGALNSASTDADDCTLILISPHSTYYDIDTAGYPTWTGNYELKGTHRTWAKIKNTNTNGSSIFKFTGKTSLQDLNFNLGSSAKDGVIMTHGGFRVGQCQFVGEDLTGSATALHLDSESQIKYGKVSECTFTGDAGSTFMTGIKIDNISKSIFERLEICECAKGIHIVGSNSDNNNFRTIILGKSGIGFDIDEGNLQSLNDITFCHNVMNIDDEVGDHSMVNLAGPQSIITEPDNFTGSTVATGDGANVWTASNVTLRSAATSTKPFRIVGIVAEGDSGEKFRLRLSSDLGSTYFDDLMVETTANVANRTSFSFPKGTETIFNQGTKIEASSKSESAGIDNLLVWLKIQEI